MCLNMNSLSDRDSWYGWSYNPALAWALKFIPNKVLPAEGAATSWLVHFRYCGMMIANFVRS